MEKPISELKDRYSGQDIYVVAAGPSTGFIEPGFFRGKIAIGVNNVWRRFRKLSYIVMKEHVRAVDAYGSGIPLILSRYSAGAVGHVENRMDGHRDYYIFEHEQNRLTDVNLDVIGTDLIVVSYSTITSAMHAAAYMGAANVILVGHDCGTLDGKMNYDGYPTSILGDDFYMSWLPQIEPQTLAVKERLQDVYGCRVYSLNPFVNFGLEGHIYGRLK